MSRFISSYRCIACMLHTSLWLLTFLSSVGFVSWEWLKTRSSLTETLASSVATFFSIRANDASMTRTTAHTALFSLLMSLFSSLLHTTVRTTVSMHGRQCSSHARVCAWVGCSSNKLIAETRVDFFTHICFLQNDEFESLACFHLHSLVAWMRPHSIEYGFNTSCFTNWITMFALSGCWQLCEVVAVQDLNVWIILVLQHLVLSTMPLEPFRLAWCRPLNHWKVMFLVCLD